MFRKLALATVNVVFFGAKVALIAGAVSGFAFGFHAIVAGVVAVTLYEVIFRAC